MDRMDRNNQNQQNKQNQQNPNKNRGRQADLNNPGQREQTERE